MTFSAAKFAVVATVAAGVGIFIALVVYATLFAALIFVLIAAALVLILKFRKRG